MIPMLNLGKVIGGGFSERWSPRSKTTTTPAGGTGAAEGAEDSPTSPLRGRTTPRAGADGGSNTVPVPPRVTAGAPSPRQWTSGNRVPSVSLAKRSSDLVPIIGMDVMQCTDVATLQKALIELGERYTQLDTYYDNQLQEKIAQFHYRLQQVVVDSADTAVSPARTMARPEPAVVVPGRSARPSTPNTVPTSLYSSPKGSTTTRGGKASLASTTPAVIGSPRREWGAATTPDVKREDLNSSVEHHSSHKTPISRPGTSSQRQRRPMTGR